MSQQSATRRQPLLLLGPEAPCRRVAGALLLIGCRGLPAADANAALRAMTGAGVLPAGGLFSGELADPVEVLRAIHATLAAPLPWTIWGARPDTATAAALRRENVRFAIAEPITEDDLRFVVEEMLQAHDGPETTRTESRVPTSLRARVVTKTGERVAVVCNLSTTGAYLSTPRPTLRGGSIEVEIALPGHPVRTEAEVLWNNVPGNLRKPHTPIGMGVRFVALAPESVDALRDYLASRAASYRL